MNMTAICEHSAGAAEYAIHGARESRSDHLEPARQIPRAPRLDDHVYVVALDRIVNEPKPSALACLPPASLQLGNEFRRTERRNILLHLQRDVTRMTRRERRPAPMWIATRRSQLPPRAGSRAAPARTGRKLE